jgi:hypothetical protein
MSRLCPPLGRTAFSPKLAALTTALSKLEGKRMGVDQQMGGAALIAASAGTIFAMAHHPTHLGSGPFVQIVHGVLIGLLGLTAFGFATFVGARGLERPAILAGAVAYVVAVFGGLTAATTNGFVVPALAARGDAAGRDLFLLTWEVDQAFATLGVVSAGLAIVFWSLDFLDRGEREPRLIGLFGLLAGAGPGLLLATGASDMRVAGAFFAYSAHALWGVAVGVHLLRGKARAAS